MMHFFDGITKLAQIGIFFTLGLLAFPREVPSILLTGMLIFLFLTFIARPAAVFLLLSFLNQVLISVFLFHGPDSGALPQLFLQLSQWTAELPCIMTCFIWSF